MNRMAAPTYTPSSYEVTPRKWPGRVSWYSRSPRAAAVATTIAHPAGESRRRSWPLAGCPGVAARSSGIRLTADWLRCTLNADYSRGLAGYLLRGLGGSPGEIGGHAPLPPALRAQDRACRDA